MAERNLIAVRDLLEMAEGLWKGTAPKSGSNEADIAAAILTAAAAISQRLEEIASKIGTT